MTENSMPAADAYAGMRETKAIAVTMQHTATVVNDFVCPLKVAAKIAAATVNNTRTARFSAPIATSISTTAA